MRKILLFILMFPLSLYAASSRELIRYVPSGSIFLVGADLSSLRANETFVDMERSGKIWSEDEAADFSRLMKILKLQPSSDIRTFVFSSYVTTQGGKGKVRLVDIVTAPSLREFAETKYLAKSLYRLDEDRDFYATLLSSSTLAFGSLNEVKMAVDVGLGKVGNLEKNNSQKVLFERIPAQAGVWGIAEPLTREKASALGVKQSTNAVLEAFEHYYFYGIPSRKTTKSHFVGRASGEKEAAFVSTFMIGTLTFAKFKVEDDVAEMLDEVNVEREGRNIRVSAVITKEMVDAYLKGDLGVD